jgi:hypothetical protein
MYELVGRKIEGRDKGCGKRLWRRVIGNRSVIGNRRGKNERRRCRSGLWCSKKWREMRVRNRLRRSKRRRRMMWRTYSRGRRNITKRVTRNIIKMGRRRNITKRGTRNVIKTVIKKRRSGNAKRSIKIVRRFSGRGTSKRWNTRLWDGRQNARCTPIRRWRKGRERKMGYMMSIMSKIRRRRIIILKGRRRISRESTVRPGRVIGTGWRRQRTSAWLKRRHRVRDLWNEWRRPWGHMVVIGVHNKENGTRAMEKSFFRRKQKKKKSVPPRWREGP